MAAPRFPKKALAKFGKATALVLGILCGVVTLAAWLAKPDGWQFMIAILAIIAVACVGWLVYLYRLSRKTKLVRCGGKEAGNPLFCGKKVPRWFLDFGDIGPPRCGVCTSGGQIRYPNEGETEEAYSAYVRATGDEQNALASEYEQLAADFARSTGNTARIVPIPEGGKLRVGQEADSDVEHEAEKEAGAKEGRRR